MKQIKVIFFMVATVVFNSVLFYSSSFSVPLTGHPTNRRYLTDGTGKAIYLTGSHTWHLVQKNVNMQQADISGNKTGKLAIIK